MELEEIKQQLTARREILERDRANLFAAIARYDGAIEENQYWLDEVAKGFEPGLKEGENATELPLNETQTS